MKKLIASLLVLASFANFGGIVSFGDFTKADQEWWDNYYHEKYRKSCELIEEPKDFDRELYYSRSAFSRFSPSAECINFTDCLQKFADENSEYTENLDKNFKDKKFLGIFPTKGSKCIEKFDEIKNRLSFIKDRFSAIANKVYYCGEVGNIDKCKYGKYELQNLKTEEAKLKTDENGMFRYCLALINFDAAADLFLEKLNSAKIMDEFYYESQDTKKELEKERSTITYKLLKIMKNLLYW